ncbi:phospholipase D-like domain-containing protein [Thalassoglobus sp.]|uniref:phospholipase D-like domain-containing protein n=1 Tax=Thalassoglobus sp. TaxID=2795869 RepID=UPI003AA8029C
MTPQEFRSVLSQTFDDEVLTRSERRALSAVLKELKPAETELDVYRHEAFEFAREMLASTPDQKKVIDWLEDVVRLLKPARENGKTVTTEAYFSPGDKCRNRIRSLLRQSRSSVDICLFTITDNEISDIIAETHNRRVQVRIITDDEKVDDAGSDIQRLLQAGVEVRLDSSPYHMHHKFALFDESILLCGSYNWTRSAAEKNEENIVVLNDEHLVTRFGTVFNDLWDQYA